MNIDSLEHFLEVAKDLNITTAAQRLYISQQALSLQMQKLEQYYGVALFKRHPRLSLTYAGQQLVQSAKAMIKEHEALKNSLTEFEINHSGILRIGIQAYRAAQCFPMFLEEYNRLWPNVTLQLVGESTEEMLRMLCDDDLDLFVGVPSQAEIKRLNDRVESTLLFDDRSYLVCSDTLLYRYFGDEAELLKEQLCLGTDLHEFAEFPMILHKPPMRIRRMADECFYKVGIKPRVYIESSNTELMISLYPCHLGAFFCRRARVPSLKNMFPDCNTFPLKYNDSLLGIPVYLMQKKHNHTPKHVIDFTKFIRKAYKKLAEY